MKHFLALLLISGYVALIPACFLGGDHSVVASAHATGSANEAGGISVKGCVLDSSACSLSGSTQGDVTHHADMYYSFLGFMQSQGLSMVAIIFLSLLPAFLFIAAARNPVFFHVPMRVAIYIKKYPDLLSIYRFEFLRWLSFSINSPSYLTRM